MNIESHDISFVSSFRIDIQCIGNSDCITIEAIDCSISKPAWFQKNGEGFVLEGKSKEQICHIKIHKKCRLSFKFMGPDIRIKGIRVPVWVTYEAITINNKPLISTPILSWHDVPYRYNLDCDELQDLVVYIKQKPYSYTREEFLNSLIALNSEYLKDRFDEIINDFQSVNRAPKITNFWNYRSEMLKADVSLKNDMLHKYYAYLEQKNSWIGHTTSFLSEPIFPHGLSGIFISGGAKIGKNCVIFQQVTIGSNTLEDSKSKGAPIIGNNVYIGAGAKIIGKVTICNNVRIGANAVVVTDVPDNSIVVMNKPRILYKEGMDNKFYHYLNGVYGYHLDGKFFPVGK